jgi:hypothetical protein
VFSASQVARLPYLFAVPAVVCSVYPDYLPSSLVSVFS